MEQIIKGSEGIDVEQIDTQVTITVNRPDVMNAMTTQMFADFGRICREVSRSESVRVVVITGAGGNFCSGADVGGQGSKANSEKKQVHIKNMRQISESVLALNEIPHPVIAKIRGVAAGAGMNLALGCDILIASETARFSEIFARRGLSIDFGGSWLLPRQIGLHRAKELVLLADVIDSVEADRIGLVNRIVTEEDLDTTVQDLADRLASGPPIALSMSKKLLNAGITSSLSQSLEAEAQAQSVNFETEDIKEAALAWLEKRPADFKGF
tara:strand:- start:37 stop:843 length:807 start_codon:yes stop_codon:yes gene_type:complete